VKVELPQTVEECHDVITHLLLIIERMEITQKQMQAKQEEMAAEILDLKQRLNQNSGNSSNPPSSDGFNKPVKSQLPKIKGRKGGQKGHPGKTLEMVAQPDQIKLCEPARCVCGQTDWISDGLVAERRQVFDLPKPKLEVIEYRRVTRLCQCGQTVSGEFPEAVVAPVQYGLGVQAMGALLSVQGCLSYRKIGQLFKDLYGFQLNESTVQTMVERTAEKMPYQEIRNALRKLEIIKVDESGIRENGKLKWLHNASSEELTYQFVHSKRGYEALLSEESVLAEFTGIAVHDCYSSYFKFREIRHALCNAHILRELNGLVENARSKWGWQMQQLLTSLYLASEGGTKKIDQISAYEKRYRQILEIGEVEEPPPKKEKKKGKLKRTKGRNLLERMKKYEEAILLFAKEQGVPFTNNQAERDISPVKIKQKVSGRFRTEKGATNYVKIYSLISTLRKQKRKVFKELTQLLEGKEFILFQT
jgi:transposase